MYCKNCGNEIKDGENACSKCGNQIINNKPKKYFSKETANLLCLLSIIIKYASAIIIYFVFDTFSFLLTLLVGSIIGFIITGIVKYKQKDDNKFVKVLFWIYFVGIIVDFTLCILLIAVVLFALTDVFGKTIWAILVPGF